MKNKSLKKILLFIVAIIMIMTIVACANSESEVIVKIVEVPVEVEVIREVEIPVVVDIIEIEEEPCTFEITLPNREAVIDGIAQGFWSIVDFSVDLSATLREMGEERLQNNPE